MTNSFAPDFCYDLIAKAFLDEAHPAYAQVATVDSNSAPHVRTVHVHFLPKLNVLAFNTHVGSSKWTHLKKNPLLSGCYVDLVRQVQFRWESQVELVEDSAQYPNLLEELWLRMRIDVRKAYWMDYKNLPLAQMPPQDIDLNTRSPNQGVVLCKPYRWNIYEIHEENYCKGVVTLHEFKNDQWYSKELSLLGREN